MELLWVVGRQRWDLRMIWCEVGEVASVAAGERGVHTHVLKGDMFLLPFVQKTLLQLLER